jgi:hypothetical protein
VVRVDADGTWLAIAVLPASVQERDTLPALDQGSTEWPSLRVGIFDGAFTADRCRESANVHGMRHHLVSRDPTKGVHRAAPALARDRLYRVAKLRFEWSATIKRDHLRLGSCESIQVQLSFHRVPPVGVC